MKNPIISGRKETTITANNFMCLAIYCHKVRTLGRSDYLMINQKVFFGIIYCFHNFLVAQLQKRSEIENRNETQLGIPFCPFHAAIRHFKVNQINGRKKYRIIYKRWAQSLMNQDYSLSKKPELLFVFIRLKNYKKVSNFDKLLQIHR